MVTEIDHVSFCAPHSDAWLVCLLHSGGGEALHRKVETEECPSELAEGEGALADGPIVFVKAAPRSLAKRGRGALVPDMLHRDDARLDTILDATFARPVVSSQEIVRDHPRHKHGPPDAECPLGAISWSTSLPLRDFRQAQYTRSAGPLRRSIRRVDRHLHRLCYKVYKSNHTWLNEPLLRPADRRHRPNVKFRDQARPPRNANWKPEEAPKQRRARAEKKRWPGSKRHKDLSTRITPRTKSPPAILQPRTSPTASPSIPPLGNDYGETTSSPLLNALDAGASAPVTSATYNTSEWTKSLPVFEDSPTVSSGNGAEDNGSGPNRPPVNSSHSIGIQHDSPPLASPPQSQARTLSHFNSGHSSAAQTYAGQQRNTRRTSTQSQRSQRAPHSTQPPLPHLPQPHFFSAPNVDFGPYPRRGTGFIPGEDDFYCGLDTLPIDSGGSRSNGDVLLLGWQGGLDVFKVEKDKLDLVGRLEGLRGAVIGARILPCVSRHDAFAASRPLVAVTIHGPLLTSPEIKHDPAGIRIDHDSPEREPPTRQKSPTPQATWNYEIRHHEISHYQTTVEVYSLRQRKHVVTLFESSLAEVPAPVSSPLFSPPPPISGLQLDVGGHFITIASSTSGEVYIYNVTMGDSSRQDLSSAFRCLGKVWTAVHSRSSGSVSSSSSSSGADSQTTSSGSGNQHTGMPMLSISQRWLAYVPATPSSQSSANGTPFVVDSYPKPAGLSSHTAPSLPQVTCSVESPEGESLFNRFAREVTQEVLKGAKWMGDQGKQAWRNYWTKPASDGDAIRYSGAIHARGQELPQAQNPLYFPPTHAHATQHPYSVNETNLVSVLDLEKLANSHLKTGSVRLSAIATFQAPLGCSFLSFAPQGLLLFTASRKGDVQFVWDLMRMAHGPVLGNSSRVAPHNGETEPSTRGPHVRQIAKFQRLTAASIVDVVWAAPQGERLAVLTERGTVHLFHLPLNAFQWPPRRPMRAFHESTSTKAEVESVGKGAETGGNTAGNSVSAAVKLLSDRTQPLIAAARSRRRSSGNGFGGISGRTVTATGVQGGKYMATGLSKSLGAATGTISNLRNSGEYRLHLPSHGTTINPGCVKWLNINGGGLIAVVGGGVLRIHRLDQRSLDKKGKRRSFSKSHVVEFGLPTLPDHILAPVIAGWLRDGESTPPSHQNVDGHWNVRAPAGHLQQSSHSGLHPLSYAEIETNPPYQPFHTDQRISLFTFDTSETNALEQTVRTEPLGESIHPAPWVFGGHIRTTKLNVGTATSPGEGGIGVEAGSVGPMENVLQLARDDDEIEQIVVTTRRRRRPAHTEGDLEDGFFEDDCEVLDYASERV
ncbi:MAG: hypothetical protein M1837_002769 [Sclerophora amabilis]|nr:MAG: hypothetical protein M1837_002769 [Sclerophora amabilis]